MKQLQSFPSLLCVVLAAAPSGIVPQAWAQKADDSHTPRLETERPRWYSRISKDYEPTSLPPVNVSNTSRIDHLYRDPHVNGVKLFLHYGDLADSVQMVKLLYELQPDEVYNLGAQSHVRVSFDIPEYTGDVDGLGAQRILEAIREAGLVKKVRYYQASSSEMFGKEIGRAHV